MTMLCLLETGSGIAEPSKRALAAAGALARSAGQDVAAAWFGAEGEVGAGELAACGATRGYASGSAALSGYAPLAWANALLGLAGSLPEPASAVLAAATDRGSEVLAHLGAITGLPMAANCVSAVSAVSVGSAGSGRLRLVRQRWAGSLLEDSELDAPLALLTVAGDAVPAALIEAVRPVDPAEVVVRCFEPALAEGDLVVRATESARQSAGVSLATARVVVGGGRGVGGPQGFAALEELADLLGGALGVSRVVTSQGWRPHRQQVGQTGTKISPEVYLACGISGAIQHLAGCQGAKTLVAVNTDPDAPFMAKADYAVIGDLHEIIPALVAAIRARHP